MAPGLLSESDDEALLASLMLKSQRGDRDAYRTLLGKVHTLVHAHVRNQLRRFSHSDPGLADDVVQEILMAIHAKRDTYDPAQYFLPWMYALTRYKLVDHLRALKRTRPEATVELSDVEGELSLDPTSELSKTTPGFEELVAKLPEKQQLVLQLVKVRGLSIREAALETGLSESDVKVSIHRAIKTLKTEWRTDEA